MGKQKIKKMKRNIIIILIFSLINSCQNTDKKSNKSQLNNNENIEFTDMSGNKISKAELQKSTGSYNYEIYGTENISDFAISLHNEARQYGQTRDYKNAILKLKQANKEAPNWAYPLYDLAYTYLLQDDYKNALKYYRLTDSIAPNGFFKSKTALFTLEKEINGTYKKGLYKSYIALEWIDNPTEKKEMIELFISKFPLYPPAWQEYSSFLDGEKRKDAIEKGLKLNPDIETKGILLINKALVININGNYNEASNILMNVIFDKNSTFGNVEMAKFVLNSISEN